MNNIVFDKDDEALYCGKELNVLTLGTEWLVLEEYSCM